MGCMKKEVCLSQAGSHEQKHITAIPEQKQALLLRPSVKIFTNDHLGGVLLILIG